MAITTGDAVPGELVTAAWGDQVRADLTAHEAAIAARVPMTGVSGAAPMTGFLYVGGDPADGVGVLLNTAGQIQSSRALVGAVGSPNMILGRGSSPGAGAPSEPYINFCRSASGNTPQQTYIGGITINTGASGVLYNTSSDERLKTYVRPVDGDAAVAKVAAMEAVVYTWNAAPEAGEQVGFFAQQLQTVAPEAVTPGHGEPGDDGFVPYGVDLSTLVPTLVAAIQTLTERITALEAAP